MTLKSCVLLCMLLLGCVMVKAQKDEDADLIANLKTQLDDKEYDKIIKENAADAQSYPAMAIYYVGMAYFNKNDDRNCIKFMNMALAKDVRLADAYFAKGSSLYFQDQYERAIKNLQNAIDINPKNSEYYTTLGDVYFKAEVYPEALTAFQNAIKQEKPVDRAYTMLGQTYFALKKPDKALETFYAAKTNLSKSSESYKSTLLNIGLLEILYEKYDKAEIALKELLQLSPENYTCMAKLVQVYYGKKDYDKAKPFQEKIYAASKAGKLKAPMNLMYCFSQFKWKDKRIEAYEKYIEPKASGDAKLIFYVLNSNDDIEYKIMTEYDPGLALTAPAMKYKLCKEQSEYHGCYNLIYPENPDYEALKKGILDILEGKVKAN